MSGGGGGDGGGGGGSGYMFQSPESIGLGYAIAIALGLLVLLSSVLLASYLCCRRRRLLRRQDHAPGIPVHAAGGVVIPRIIFVAEDDDDEGAGAGGGVQGLDQAVINSYPKFPFSGAAKDRPNADAVCSICLCDYKDGEMLRMLPDCRHYFHLFCVDGWLRLNASCPICRTSPLPTPISTPLAEVVPLSQYPARTRR